MARTSLDTDFSAFGSEPEETLEPFPREVEFDENLAETLDDNTLRDLGTYLIEVVKSDEQVRNTQWNAKVAQGIRRLNFTIDPDKPDAIPESEGSINVRYPLIKEGITQFQARAMEEIFPPQGPVKTKIQGKKSKARIARAKRVQENLNYQVTTLDTGWQLSDDKMMMLLPLFGCMFKRVTHDRQYRRNISRTVRGDAIIMPYEIDGIHDTPRWAYKYFEYEQDFLTNQQTGQYVMADINTLSAAMSDPETENTDIDEAIDEIDGTETPIASLDVDRGFHMYEVHCDLDLDQESEPWKATATMKPYMIFVEQETKMVFGVYPDWEDEDETYERLNHLIQYDFLPGFGAYGIGLYHMIGDLDEAAGALLVSLIDAGEFSSAQGGLVSKDVAPNGMSIDIKKGVYKATDIPVENLQGAFFTPNFSPPAPVLHQLLTTIIEAAKSYSNTTEAMTGTGSTTGPVGTMALLVEQGSKVYSGIHKRTHNSKKQEYQALYDLTYKHLAAEGYPYPLEDDEDPSIMYEDFEDDLDVLPVSDPNIASNQQRIALAQATYQMATEQPELYDSKEVNRRLLEAMRVPDYESLFADATVNEKAMDPATENAMFLVNNRVQTYPDDHHQAHVAVHNAFLTSPIVSNLLPEQMQVVFMTMQQHILFHQAYLYLQQIGAPPINLEEPDDSEEDLEMIPPELIQQISAAQAQKVGPPRGEPQAPEPPPTPEQQLAAQKQQEFEEEEKRKQQSWQAEEQRKQAEFQEEMKREQQKQTMEMAKAQQQQNIDAARQKVDRALNG